MIKCMEHVVLLKCFFEAPYAQWIDAYLKLYLNKILWSVANQQQLFLFQKLTPFQFSGVNQKHVLLH